MYMQDSQFHIYAIAKGVLIMKSLRCWIQNNYVIINRVSSTALLFLQYILLNSCFKIFHVIDANQPKILQKAKNQFSFLHREIAGTELQTNISVELFRNHESVEFGVAPLEIWRHLGLETDILDSSGIGVHRLHIR